MELLLLLAGSLLVLALVKLLLGWRSPPGPPLPPGPRGLRGTLEFLRFAFSNNLRFGADHWAQQYGGIVFVRVLGQDICFLNSSSSIRRVLTGETTRTLASGRPATFYGEYVMYNCQDLACQTWGDSLVRMRKMFHSCLKAYGEGLDRLERLMVDEIQKLSNTIKVSKVVNMSAAIDQSILNILHMLLTGEDVTDPAHSTDVMREYALLDGDFFLFDINALLTSFPFLRFLPGRYGRGYRHAMRLKKALARIYFDRMKSTYSQGSVRGFIDGMLEFQLSLREKGEDWLTDDHLKGTIQDVIAAGYSTTNGALCGFFLLMTQHPDVQRRLQEELDRVVGERIPTLKDRPELPFLEAVTLETLRYIGHVPFPPPREAVDDILVDGYRIPKGSTILLALSSAFHDDQVWDKPWEFRPDRFLDAQGQLLPNDHPRRQNLMPFGLGKRKCPGESFARSRMFLYIAILLKNFTFRACADRPEVSPDSRTWRSELVMQPPEFYVTVQPRQSGP